MIFVATLSVPRRYLASDCAVPLEMLNEHHKRVAADFAMDLGPGPPTTAPPASSSAGPTAQAGAGASPSIGSSFALPAGDFGQVQAAPQDKDKRTKSFFLSDTFHDLQELRDAFGTSNTHSAFFVKSVADSGLVDDPNDHQRGLDHLMQRNGWTLDEAKMNINRFKKNHPEHFRKTHPDPITLCTSMKMIENIFKDCVCTKGKKPAKLFNEARWDKWNGYLQRILAGHVGEAPGARYGAFVHRHVFFSCHISVYVR